MDYNWSLNELYTGFDSTDFKEDFKSLENELKALNAAAESLKDGNSLEIYFKHYEKFSTLLSRLFPYCNLTFSVNTKDEKALQFSDKILTLYNNTTLARTKCIAFLNQIEDIDAIIKNSEYLSSLSFIIMELKASGAHMLSESEEVIASKLSQTGSTAWSTLQSKLTSTLTATLTLGDKTEILPIATIRNLASDPDPKVRKVAYEAELLAYQKVDEAIALSLNSIKGEVITMSELRGYTSPLYKTLEDSRMSKKNTRCYV